MTIKTAKLIYTFIINLRNVHWPNLIFPPDDCYIRGKSKTTTQKKNFLTTTTMTIYYYNTVTASKIK